MEDNKFWITLWCPIIAGIVILATTGMYHSSNLARAQYEIIAKSADPIATACAIQLDGTDTSKSGKIMLCVDKARK
jgi:hypothetical protein